MSISFHPTHEIQRVRILARAGAAASWRRVAVASAEVDARFARLTPRLRGALWIPVVAVLAVAEAKTGVLQSLVFSSATSRLQYRVEPMESSSIMFPEHGPLDTERGHSRIPAYTAEPGAK